jgi:hypothetical protein
MTRNKDGSVVISKETWAALAGAHRSFAGELGLLLKAPAASLPPAISELAAKHMGLGVLCERIKTDVRKGRPKKEPINTLAAMASRPTRKPTHIAPESYDLLTYQAVEIERNHLLENGQSATIASGIESLLLKAKPYDKVQHTYKEENRSRMRSAYGRGKNQSAGKLP